MAYDDSEALQPDNSYRLGGYIFDLNVSYIHEPDEDLVAISAICNGPDGRRESAPIYVPNGTMIESWSVEANETEATVYAHVVVTPPDYGIVEPFIPSDLVPGTKYGDERLVVMSGYSELIKTAYCPGFTVVNASLTFVTTRMYAEPTQGWGMGYGAQTAFTYKGKTVYYGTGGATFSYWNSFGSGQMSAEQTLSAPMVAWIMFYGQGGRTESDEMIGRFAINLCYLE